LDLCFGGNGAEGLSAGIFFQNRLENFNGPFGRSIAPLFKGSKGPIFHEEAFGKKVMIPFPVSEEKSRLLREKMESLGIREEDLEERFIRSSGAGGQKVNKTSSCVYLRHLPTGIEVKCMRERSQSLNRFLARRELVERIERLMGRGTQRDVEIERRRRQKAKRRKRAKEKYEA
jgi:hypothetical protein